MKGERGWLILAGAVLLIDAAAPEGETLSEAIHRTRRRHPALVYAAVIATAVHLLAGDHPHVSRIDIYRALGWLLRRGRF